MPPLLILGGISGAGMIATLKTYQPILMVVTFAFLGLAFYLTYRSAARNGPSKMMTINKIMLWTVTVVVVFFLFFPQYLTQMVSSDESFTADMERTVLTIEGMT